MEPSKLELNIIFYPLFVEVCVSVCACSHIHAKANLASLPEGLLLQAGNKTDTKIHIINRPTR